METPIVVKVYKNSKLREELLDTIKIKEVVAPDLLEEVIEAIISDEEEDLLSRSIEELSEMFGKKKSEFLFMSESELHLFVRSKAYEWGLTAMNFSIKEFVAHFIDHDSYEEFWEQVEDFEMKLSELEIYI